MDEELDGLLIGVRADTGAFARDVAAMRTSLEEGLGAGAERAGRLVEAALLRSIRTGKLGFEDLKHIALSAMNQIAAAALRTAIGGIGGMGGGGLGVGLTALVGAAIGLPGRATGGPVAPGRGYVVGERGPELFVPTSSGQVVAPLPQGGRDIRVAITINSATGGETQALARSGRQVARAVCAALEAAEA